jgi:hypothetical protein
MKYLIIFILSLCVAQCVAQERKSRLDVAYSLYSGCVSGLLRGATGDLVMNRTREAIRQNVAYYDEFCAVWVGTWYPTLLPDETLNDTESAELDNRRRKLLNGIEQEYLGLMPK